MKPLASNQRRTKLEIRARANSHPRRSAYRTLLQKGRAADGLKRHRGTKSDRIYVDPDWPLLPKSVWFAPQPPCFSANVRYLGGENDALNSEDQT
jgi:hypothetical protein